MSILLKEVKKGKPRKKSVLLYWDLKSSDDMSDKPQRSPLHRNGK